MMILVVDIELPHIESGGRIVRIGRASRAQKPHFTNVSSGLPFSTT
jgi:hypothetical protein